MKSSDLIILPDTKIKRKNDTRVSQQCINFQNVLICLGQKTKSLYLHVHNRPSLVHKGPSQVCKKSSEVHMKSSQFFKRSCKIHKGPP